MMERDKTLLNLFASSYMPCLLFRLFRADIVVVFSFPTFN
jgi:hypothetical protein